MNTVRIPRRAFLRPVAVTLCVAMFSGAAVAGGSQTHERAGLLSGILLGAALGGPPGAIVGAIGGGLTGRSVGREQALDRQAAEIERLRAELEQAQVRAAARTEASDRPSSATVASTAPVALNLWQPGVTLETSVQFRTGSAQLEPHFVQQLHRLAAFAVQLSNATVSLFGYADARGGEQANLQLSSARVRAVRTALVTEGVSEHNINSKALGESQPLYADTDREGRGFERRVLIRIDSEEPQS